MATYSKIEHGLYENPKIVGLSDAAFRAYVESILFSGKHLTDGFLDERIVRRMWGGDVAAELCSNDPVNPSWVAADGGWQIYGYSERQTSKADVDAVRERKRSAANARWEAKRNAEPMHGASIVHSTTHANAMPDIDIDIDTDIDIHKTPSGAKAKETRLPADWVPTKSHYEIARERNLDIQHQAEMFRLHAETHDRHAARWNAAFTTWLKKSNAGPARAVVDNPAAFTINGRKPAWKTGEYDS
jgi:hypothetical protein